MGGKTGVKKPAAQKAARATVVAPAPTTSSSGGRGKGGKGLGLGKGLGGLGEPTRRHRRLLRDNIMGVTKPASMFVMESFCLYPRPAA